MSLIDIRIDEARLKNNFDELAEIGATLNGGISRLALSNEDLEARAWLADQFETAGLIVRDDDAGNLSGILPAKNRKAKTLLIGSHLDSVPNGGRYDCSLGAITALECVRAIKESGQKLKVHLEVIDFTDEEGAWQSLFGSRAITGNLHDLYMNEKSADYAPLRAALFRAGIRPRDVYRARRDPETIAGYIELHIEQGYQLYEQGVDIGVVTAIIGRTTYKLTFIGEASHSGTTAMDKRRDALHGAAQYITRAHEFARTQYPEGIFHCGNLEVFPGKFNIIPDKAVLTMECRHPDETRLTEMEDAMIQLTQQTASDYKLTVSAKREIHMPAANMSELFIQATNTACEDLHVSHMPIISYAGHDAQILNTITPTGMIFLPSVDGISHSPKEFTEWQHIVQGANVLLHTVLNVAGQF